jgi:regulation of enolase protein 1 (concanavalin A-like superfamily)
MVAARISRVLALCWLLVASLTRLDAQVNVLTYHNDLSRTGQNLNETILTPSNVNETQFGQLFKYTVDGNVYAQPLYMSGVIISGTVHNVIFICTAHDSVYAFDADSNTGANGGLLWHVSLGTSAATPNNTFGNRYGAYQDIVPEVGIIGTPVIDGSTNTLYVDAFTNDSGTTYYHRIHALSIYNGSEKFGGPLLVQATYPGGGVASSGGVLSFANEYSNQRPALAFLNGKLYVAYAGFADTNPYHGWLLSFNTSPSLSLSQVWVSTPNSTTAEYGGNAGEGGIWESGGGLAFDPNNTNNMFMMTGNGIYGNATGGFTSPTEFGDSFVKLSATSFPTSSVTPPLDWFTPYNQASLQSSDSDLGSGAPIMLPNGVGSAAHPHLMIGAGKAGLIYVVDRDTMTTNNVHYNTAGSPDPVVQTLQISSGAAVFSTPAYFNGKIYFGPQTDVMRQFSVANGVISGPLVSGTRSLSHPGVTPSISASGTTNAIVWGIAYGTPAVLFASNANSVATEIYNSAMAGTRDQLPNGVKFTVPTIANGKVYVGASGAVAVFGLLGNATSPPTAPSGLTAAPVSAAQINLAWKDNATTANGYEIFRSTDNVNFAQINIAAASATNYLDTSCAADTTYYYKVAAENSAGASGFSNVASATTANTQANAGLVAHWALDDGSGLIATDSMGEDNGTLDGEVSWTTGIIGGALDFHGGGAATARVSIPDEAAIDFSATSSFTLTAWVEPGNTPGKYSEVISKSRGVSPWYELGIDPANNWVFRGTASDVEGTPVASGWHHLACVQNGAAGTRTLYVDGVPVATGTAQAANGTGELVFAEADTVSESFSGVIDDVRIYNLALTGPQIATLAQTTWTDSDIGNVGLAGSATIYDGVFGINGSGTDIGGTADAFNFVYQPIIGDCIITGRTVALQDTNTFAKCGVMIRETLDPGSAFADCFISYGEGSYLQYRTAANNNSGSAAGSTTVVAPYWVRLSRTGNVITAYQSPDGSTWTEIGAETFTMAPDVYVGLCVTSCTNNQLCSATMDNVTLSTEGSLQFSNASYSVSETSPSATITVSRTGGSLDAVGVAYSTVPGGLAVAGSNYVATRGALNWANGDSSPKSFTVPILNPNVPGPNLSLNLALSNPTGGITLGTLSTATLTILQTSYNAWLYAAYGANAANTAYSAPLATPSGDGICNLVKYAMSINPGLNGESQLPGVAMVNGHPQVTFQWNYGISDVTYVVQASSSPNGPWSPLATYTAAGGWVANVSGVTITPGSVAGTAPYQYEPVTVVDPITVTAGQGRFYCVSLTQ